jgi:hypothetical protein
MYSHTNPDLRIYKLNLFGSYMMYTIAPGLLIFETKKYLVACENMFRARIFMTDEVTEKRWLFDTLRYNLQNLPNNSCFIHL